MTVFPLLQICLVSLVIKLGQGQLEWIPVEDKGTQSPSIRRDAAIGFYANTTGSTEHIILFGGRGNGILDDTWLFNLQTGIWTMVTLTTKPPPRFSMVYGLSGDNFYVATGEGPSDVFYNDIWKFDMLTLTWSELPAQPRPDYVSVAAWAELESSAYRPAIRYGAAGGIYPGSNRFFVHQGFAKQRYFDTNVYDVVDQQWNLIDCKEGACTPYNPRYPHARCLHSGTMIGEEEYVMFGGCLTGGGTGGPCPAGDSWILDARTLKWTELDACPIPRTYSSMAMLPIQGGERRVVLYGGLEKLPQVIQTTKSTEDLVAVLNVGSQQWELRRTEKKPSFPVLRASASMATGTTGIYMFGGMNVDSNAMLNDIWLLAGDSSSAGRAPKVDCPTIFTNFILVHGIFMVLAWGVFLLWGAFVARYFSSSGKVWFYLHVSFQVIGLILGLVGFGMAVASVQFDHIKFAHGIIGLVVTLLLILQPVNALFRPPRPEEGLNVPSKRLLWEFIHHFGGKAAIFLALINISLGVFVANSHEIAWGVWFGYLVFVLIVFIAAELGKRTWNKLNIENKVHHSEKIKDEPEIGAKTGKNKTIIESVKL